jgi:hypothetical protein
LFFERVALGRIPSAVLFFLHYNGSKKGGQGDLAQMLSEPLDEPYNFLASVR